MPSEAARPAYTVVIPTYGRPHLVKRCLGALARVRPPPGGFEVVVVDDGSPDRLEAVVTGFADTLNIRLYRQRNAGPATARNHGVRRARGRWIAFLDDDCMPEEDWLLGFEPVVSAEPGCVAGGRMVSNRNDSVYSIASNMLVAYLYGYYNRGDDARFFTTANLVCEREAFLAFGGFDPTFRIAAAEDRDFCDRWAEAGLPMRSAENAVVHHAPRLTYRAFMRQHFNYGRGARHLHAARKRRGLERPRLEPMSFYTGLLLSPLRTKLGPSRIALAGLMLLSQVAYAFGYYLERMGGPPSGPALEPTATPADDGQVPDAPELETRRGNGMASGR